MSSNLISTPLDECQSWWASTLRAMPAWRHNLCALRLVERQLTSFPLRHWNLRNLTLQQECYLTNTRDFFRQHSTFARLYNAAASPAPRLRSAGSLAIICKSGVFTVCHVMATSKNIWIYLCCVKVTSLESPFLRLRYCNTGFPKLLQSCST